VDISETFIAEAESMARREGVSADFRVGDVNALHFSEQFDLVTWIEKPIFHDGMPDAIHRSLAPGGRFVGDVRNPENPKTQSRAGDWRTWREKDGVFYLEAHENHPDQGIRQDLWVRIDPERGVIEEEVNTNDIRSDVGRNLQTALEELPKVGFSEIELRTMDGMLFTGGKEPYWLWIVAKK
jgi:SAM-dependent methyltransferase